jgi:acyltransferase
MRRMNPSNHRYFWVDYAKSLAIYLMVLGHSPIPDYAFVFIYSFHMPLFFLVSGFLDKNTSLHETIIKSAKTLLVPYVIMYAGTYVFWIIWANSHPDIYAINSNTLTKSLLGLFFGVGYDTDYSIMTNPPLWFLPCLFVVKCMHSLLVNRFGQKTLALGLFAVVSILSVVLLKRTGVDLFFSVDSALMAYPFYLFGIQMRRHEIVIGKRLWCVIIVICLAITICAGQFNTAVSMDNFIFGRSVPLFYFTALAGSIMIIGVSHLAEGCADTVVEVISYGTIFILAFQIAGIPILNLIFQTFGLIGRGEQFLTVRALIALVYLAVAYLIIKHVGYRFPVVVGRWR